MRARNDGEHRWGGKVSLDYVWKKVYNIIVNEIFYLNSSGGGNVMSTDPYESTSLFIIKHPEYDIIAVFRRLKG